MGEHGPQFAELLDTLGEAVTIRDPGDRLVYANRAALRHLGYESLQDIQRRGLNEIMSDYVVLDDQGQPVQMSDLPSVRLLQGKPAEPLLIHSINRHNGTSRWELLKTAALRGGDGRLIAAVTVIEDVTALKAAEVRMRLLSESSRILASSLDYQQTLENVAHVAVPSLSDCCVVDLLDEELVRTEIVVAHHDVTKRELLSRLRQFEPRQLEPESTLGRVARTGDPELFTELPTERLARVARSGEHLRLLLELEIRSAIVVAMRTPARTLGLMTFFTDRTGRQLGHEDVDVAEQLGRRAAVAVENARLHTALTRVSQTLQQSLRPAELPTIPGWDLAALYRPAGAEQRAEVGGDFYEVFTTAGASLALIGDVTGRGVAAAALTALMRHGARFASRLEPRPAAILAQLDEELRARQAGELCTALCARLYQGKLVLSSAGHPPAWIVDLSGTVFEAPEPGPLLGAFSDGRWPQETLEVRPDQLVLLYTDGVTETVGSSGRFGPERLQRVLAEHARLSPAQLLEALDAELAEFRHGPAMDDVAALALRPRT